jgi:hypothetical protein
MEKLYYKNFSGKQICGCARPADDWGITTLSGLAILLRFNERHS